MENQQNELEIDLVEVLLYLKSKLLVIVLTTLLLGAVGFAYSKFMIEPTYTASTRVYVLNKKEDSHLNSADLQLSTYLMEDYKILITGRNVTQEVINRLGLDMTPEQLASKITVSAPEKTRVLQISVVDNDPNEAAKIANCVRSVAAVQIKEIMDVDAVNVVYEATAPRGKSAPSIGKNTILASMLGFIISAGIYVVIFMLDDTIKTEEDVEHYLGLSTLGIIPVSTDLDMHTDVKKKRGKFKKLRVKGKH